MIDLVLSIAAMVLLGVLHGSIAGVYIHRGRNGDVAPVTLGRKVVLCIIFPFTIASICAAKAMVWALASTGA